MAGIGQRTPVARDAFVSAFLAAIAVIVVHLAFVLAVLAWRRSVDLPCGLEERRRAEEARRARQ